MASPGDVSFRTLLNNSTLSTTSKTAFVSWADNANHRLQTNSSQSTFSELLEVIPTPKDSGAIPLASLGFLLSRYPESLPTFDILRRYSKLWHGLPNVVKANQDGDRNSILQEVLGQVKSLLRQPSITVPTRQCPPSFD